MSQQEQLDAMVELIEMELRRRADDGDDMVRRFLEKAEKE